MKSSESFAMLVSEWDSRYYQQFSKLAQNIVSLGAFVFVLYVSSMTPCLQNQMQMIQRYF